MSYVSAAADTKIGHTVYVFSSNDIGEGGGAESGKRDLKWIWLLFCAIYVQTRNAPSLSVCPRRLLVFAAGLMALEHSSPKHCVDSCRFAMNLQRRRVLKHILKLAFYSKSTAHSELL